MNKEVPFLDLVTPHRDMEAELTAVVRSALQTARFIGGPLVEDFERDFANFCGSRYCIGVGSGTDALRFALIAAGVKRGDMVLTVPFTFIATTEAITQAGARPVFVDIDPQTCNMDPAKLRTFLETRCIVDDKTGMTLHRNTKQRVSAILPVHLYGQMSDMNAMLKIGNEYNITVLEDACQAHGAAYYSDEHKQWRRAGSAGKAAAFSFYPGKNLGACGEGGAVTTDDEEIALKVRMLRDHGQMKKYVHTIEGYNGRLDAIQAGILQAKLKYLSEWNEKRREIASRYNHLLGQHKDVTLPHEPNWSRGVYHLYVIRVPKREELQSFLSGRKIATGLHYPIPLHLQEAYETLDYRTGDFPVAEQTAREILSLPMFPGLTGEQQLQVVESILQFQTHLDQAA